MSSHEYEPATLSQAQQIEVDHELNNLDRGMMKRGDGVYITFDRVRKGSVAAEVSTESRSATYSPQNFAEDLSMGFIKQEAPVGFDWGSESYIDRVRAIGGQVLGVLKKFRKYDE